MRSVARDAEVDPALITYSFKSKTGPLDAALIAPPAWTEAVAAWEDPAIAEFLRAAILTAAHEPIALQRLASNFAVYILEAVSRIDDEEHVARASLVSTQMVGLAIIR